MRFEELVKAHGGRLYRLAYFYLHDAQAAEDAVQEAYLRYLKEKAVITPGGWLNRVVRNICLNELRQRGRVEHADPADLQINTEAFDAPVVEALTMSDALLRLPLHYREALVWRYYLQIPDGEAARQLAMSPVGWRSRLMRARQALAQQLREEVHN